MDWGWGEYESKVIGLEYLKGHLYGTGREHGKVEAASLLYVLREAGCPLAPGDVQPGQLALAIRESLPWPGFWRQGCSQGQQAVTGWDLGIAALDHNSLSHSFLPSPDSRSVTAPIHGESATECHSGQ